MRLSAIETIRIEALNKATRGQLAPLLDQLRAQGFDPHLCGCKDKLSNAWHLTVMVGEQARDLVALWPIDHQDLEALNLVLKIYSADLCADVRAWYRRLEEGLAAIEAGNDPEPWPPKPGN